MFERKTALEAIDKELAEFGKAAKKLGGSPIFMLKILEKMRSEIPQDNDEKAIAAIKALQCEIEINRKYFCPTNPQIPASPKDPDASVRGGQFFKTPKDPDLKTFKTLTRDDPKLDVPIRSYQALENKNCYTEVPRIHNKTLENKIRDEEQAEQISEKQRKIHSGECRPRSKIVKYGEFLKDLIDEREKIEEAKRTLPEGVFCYSSPVLGPRLNKTPTIKTDQGKSVSAKTLLEEEVFCYCSPVLAPKTSTTTTDSDSVPSLSL